MEERQKRVKEMAHSLCHWWSEKKGNCTFGWVDNPCTLECNAFADAERLYNADYRRQSDTAREIFAEIDGLMLDGEIGGKYPAKVISPAKYAELKKKYKVDEAPDTKEPQPTEATKTAPPNRGSGVQKYVSTAEHEPIISKATYERVQRTMQGIEAATPFFWIPPLGYKVEMQGEELIVDEEEAEVVRRAIEEMNSNGQLSEETANELRRLWELHYKVPKEDRLRLATVDADRWAAMIVAKSAMQAHEAWKAAHPRPERAPKKEAEE